jgi:hypothetical protein
MRQYIRHPSDIPIEIIRGRQSLAQASSRIHDVSYGGLALKSSRELEPGIVVEVRIPCVRPVFTTKARVAWCRAQSDGFELGVEFLDANDAFRARMVEQVCYIQNYRKAVYEQEGRVLSSEEAAMEWIGKHAAQFVSASDDVH